MKYKRILLKLSGEALLGKNSYGIDNEKLLDYAKEIKELHFLGIEIAIVIGGGNIYRGVAGAKNGIDRVEILKGSQSSLYGANAIGGTINIFTKQGREGSHSNFEIETASKNTKNISYSIDGADDKFNYYLGLNKFVTDGISAMNDNDEKDQYKNDNIVANIGYKINENFSSCNFLTNFIKIL